MQHPSETRISQRGLVICAALYLICPLLALAAGTALMWIIFGAAGWSVTTIVATIDVAGFVFLAALARWRGKQLTSVRLFRSLPFSL